MNTYFHLFSDTNTYSAGAIEAGAQGGQSVQKHVVIIALDCIERLDIGQSLDPPQVRLHKFPKVHHTKGIINILNRNDMKT